MVSSRLPRARSIAELRDGVVNFRLCSGKDARCPRPLGKALVCNVVRPGRAVCTKKLSNSAVAAALAIEETRPTLEPKSFEPSAGGVGGVVL